MSSSEISALPGSSPDSAPESQAVSAEAEADHSDPPQPAPAAMTVAEEAHGNLALAMVVLGLSLIGQFYFSRVRADLADGALFFAGAIVLFLILVRRSEAGPAEGASWAARVRSAVDRIQSEPIKTVLVVLSLALAYTTVRLLRAKPGNTPYWDVFALWIISFLCYAAAFVRLPRLDLRQWLRTYRLDVITAVLLTGAAAVLRFWALGSVPNIISGDEGVLGTLGVQVLQGKLNHMMATTYGHSTLFLFMIAGVMKLLGVSAVSLRFMSALSGALTVPALYLIARRLFNARVALVAAALLAVSHFHLHFSRVIVAGSIQDALVATLTFFFFFTGLEQRSVTRMVLSGLIVGFGLYLYMGARLIILFLPVYSVALLMTNPKLVLDNLGRLLAFAGALLVISAPMVLWAIDHSAEFMARANQLGVIQSGWLANEAQRLGQSEFRILLDLLRQAFLTVNYYPSFAFHYSDLPMLDFVTGAVFWLGLAYSLVHVADPRHLLLNGWFWSGVLVGGALVLLPGNSHYRIMIVFPAVCLFVALAWDKLVEFGGRMFGAGRLMRRAPTVAFVAIFALLNLKAYFVDYVPRCKYEDVNTRLASQIGSYMGRLGPTYAQYLVTAPRFSYGIHRSLDFLSGGLLVTDLRDPLTVPPTSVDPHSRAAFYFTPEREHELGQVQSYMPGGKIDRVYDCGKLLMTVYVTPGG